MPDRLSGKH